MLTELPFTYPNTVVERGKGGGKKRARERHNHEFSGCENDRDNEKEGGTERGRKGRKRGREGGEGAARTDALKLLLEPVDGILLRHSVRSSYTPHLKLPAPYTETLAAQHDVEIHTVDAGRRVVFQPQIDVLSNAEAWKDGGKGRRGKKISS